MTYVFRVSTTDDTGSGSPAQSEWRFSIAPMFYQSRWFYAAIAVTAGRRVRPGLADSSAQRSARSSRCSWVSARASAGKFTTRCSRAWSACRCSAIRLPPISRSDAKIKRDKFVLMRKQVQEYIREAHEAIWDLRSGKLQDRDLATALRESDRAGDQRPRHSRTVRHCGLRRRARCRRSRSRCSRSARKPS